MMSALRRDLFGRRLWPVIVLLLVAIVAVPLVLRKNARADVAPVPPAPPLAGAASPAKHTAAPASGSPLPVGMPRDPFASGIVRANTKPAPTQATASVTAPSSVAASTTATSPAVVSPSPTTSSSGSATTPTPTTTTTTTTPTTTTTTTTTGTSVPVPTADLSWTVYGVALRVGTGSFAPLRSDVVRLTPLPSVAQPKAMFMGVMAGGTEAVFALGARVQHAGPGLCRPDRKRCAALVLRVGQTEQIVAAAAGGPRQFDLSLVSIAGRVTHSRDEALAAFNRHSAAGLCELDLANPVTYSQGAGTVSSVAATTCKDQPAAVPFPGGLDAP
jgi:hypothetical protein